MTRPESIPAWTLRPFDPASGEQAHLWRGLARRAGACSVLLPEFVFTCAEQLGKRPLQLAICGPADAPIAMALVDRCRLLLPEVFVENQMPLGAWLSLPGLDFARLAAALVRSMGPALRLGVSQLDSRYVPRPGGEGVLGTLDYMETPWVELDGSFDAYWASRGKNLRTNMRRQREKLAGQGVEARMEVLTDAARMPGAVRDYASLESRGWKAAGGTAVSEDHPQAAFYVAMLERFAVMGMARVYRYWFGDRLVASELCLHDGAELIILKTTYDESTAPLSPASLLRQDMFEALFADGRTNRVEFYGPLKDWHTRWTPLHRPVYHANVYRIQTVKRINEFRRARSAA